MTFKIGKQHTFLVQLHAEVRYEHDFCFDGPQLNDYRLGNPTFLFQKPDV